MKKLATPVYLCAMFVAALALRALGFHEASSCLFGVCCGLAGVMVLVCLAVLLLGRDDDDDDEPPTPGWST